VRGFVQSVVHGRSRSRCRRDRVVAKAGVFKVENWKVDDQVNLGKSSFGGDTLVLSGKSKV